jgi:hypothetical protein
LCILLQPPATSSPLSPNILHRHLTLGIGSTGCD